MLDKEVKVRSFQDSGTVSLAIRLGLSARYVCTESHKAFNQESLQNGSRDVHGCSHNVFSWLAAVRSANAARAESSSTQLREQSSTLGYKQDQALSKPLDKALIWLERRSCFASGSHRRAKSVGEIDYTR